MAANKSFASEPGIWGVFDDPAFQAILNQFMSRCITWEEFLSFKMPLSMSPLAMWEILQRLSRYLGVELPIPDCNDQEHWYLRTYELTDAIHKVTHACRMDSHLYQSITRRDAQHFLLNVRIAEAIAAARLDGIAVCEDEIDSLLRLGREPRNATERLLANTFLTVDKVADFVDQAFSRDLCNELYGMLTRGVNMDEIKLSVPIPLGTGLFEWDDAIVEKYADRQLGYILAWANHNTGSEYDHHVLRTLLLPDAFRFYRPFKFLSYQIGRIVGYIYALKHNLPVFNLLPASRVKLDWDRGLILPPAVSFDRPTFERMRRRSPGNLTCMQTLVAQLMLIALRIVEHYVAAWEDCDVQLREILKKDADINYRQRAILGRALRKPNAEFTIHYHKNNHAIAYPTARADFLELVEKGYLTQCKRGNAFVFIPSKNLRAMFINQQTLAHLDNFAMLKSFLHDRAPYKSM